MSFPQFVSSGPPPENMKKRKKVLSENKNKINQAVNEQYTQNSKCSSFSPHSCEP